MKKIDFLHQNFLHPKKPKKYSALLINLVIEAVFFIFIHSFIHSFLHPAPTVCHRHCLALEDKNEAGIDPLSRVQTSLWSGLPGCPFMGLWGKSLDLSREGRRKARQRQLWEAAWAGSWWASTPGSGGECCCREPRLQSQWAREGGPGWWGVG